MSYYDDPPRDYSDEHANRAYDDGEEWPDFISNDCCDRCGARLGGYSLKTFGGDVICEECAR